VIELAMVRRMVRSTALLAPPLAAGLWLAGGGEAALSGAVGLAMALGNLWLAGRVIGGVAESRRELLPVAGLAAFGLGLVVLTGVALALRAGDVVSFPVAGFTLVGAHLALVLREAARAFPVSGGHADDDVLRGGSRGWS